MEHLTGGPFSAATESNTAQVVIEFLKKEIMLIFGPPQRMIKDNATCFTSRALVGLMKNNSISWRAELVYAPMYNGKTEHMVRTLKSAVNETFLEHCVSWGDVIPSVLCGYRRRTLSSGFSPFELILEFRLVLYMLTVNQY